MKILIVDDHADMRRTLRTIIDAASVHSHDFIECTDGQEAVEQFALHRPDVVIMDVQLKTVDGFTAVKKIMELRPGSRVIFVSAHDSPGVRERAARLHAVGFVSKDNLMELPSFISAAASAQKGE